MDLRGVAEEAVRGLRMGITLGEVFVQNLQKQALGGNGGNSLSARPTDGRAGAAHAVEGGRQDSPCHLARVQSSPCPPPLTRAQGPRPSVTRFSSWAQSSQQQRVSVRQARSSTRLVASGWWSPLSAISASQTFRLASAWLGCPAATTSTQTVSAGGRNPL